jgi:TPR repeat protein
MYFEGLGVPQDYVKSYMWTNFAADKGIADAKENWNLLMERITSSQIEAAQRLTREWIATHPQVRAAQ